MSKTIHLNDEQLEVLNEALSSEIDRTGVGKQPNDVHIRYLGALLKIRDKLKLNKEE